jgi:hypothetical protein
MSLKVIEVAERYADGLVATKDLHDWGWLREQPGGMVALYKAWDAAQSAADYASGIAAQATASSDTEKSAAWQEAFQAAWDHGASPTQALAEADAAIPASSAWLALRETARKEERDAQANLLRDIFGNPFRQLPLIDSAWIVLHEGTIARLAWSVYEERKLPAGTFEAGRLGVLADALEEAGCAQVELLTHLRSPGPHVRGCFAVDAMLAKL